jgi:hypothetical protein
MKKYVLILFFVFITTKSYSQRLGGRIGDYLSIAGIRNINLFDSVEIKKKKFSKAFVIHESTPEDSNGLHIIDTVLIYTFNNKGIPVLEIGEAKIISNPPYTDPLRKVRDTIILDKFFAPETPCIISYNYKKDSIRTHYELDTFNGKCDTIAISKEVYSNKLLIERTRLLTYIGVKTAGCLTNAFRHAIYRYDDKGRLIYQGRFSEISRTYGLKTEWKKDSYLVISYPFYGKLIEEYDGETDELIDKEAILINESKGIIT